MTKENYFYDKFFIKIIVMLSCIFFVSDISSANEKKLTANSTFEAYGERLYIEQPSISFNSVPGWVGEYYPDSGVTLKMTGAEHVIKEKNTTYKYRPSFSIRTVHHPSPIDEQRKKQFIEEITHQFTEAVPHKEFQILNSTDYQTLQPSQAYVVYSSYVSSGLDIIQIHVLLSSATEQFILSYSDLDELFRTDSERAQIPWQMIGSFEVQGNPSPRYAGLVLYGSLSILILLIVIIRSLIYRRRQLLELKRITKSKLSTKKSYNNKKNHRKSTNKKPAVSFA